MNKLFLIGIIMFATAVILNVLETAYYGFNMHPISKNEEQWDVYCKLLANLGLSVIAIALFVKIYHRDKEEP